MFDLPQTQKRHTPHPHIYSRQCSQCTAAEPSSTSASVPTLVAGVSKTITWPQPPIVQARGQACAIERVAHLLAVRGVRRPVSAHSSGRGEVPPVPAHRHGKTVLGRAQVRVPKDVGQLRSVGRAYALGVSSPSQTSTRGGLSIRHNALKTSLQNREALEVINPSMKNGHSRSA